MQQIVRDVVVQPFSTFVIAVGVTATPISLSFTRADLIDSFTLSLDAGAANNVFIGDQGVTIATGLEIIAGGGPITFRIRNQNQHYELQEPLLTIADALTCPDINLPRPIPFRIWDLQQIYLVATAATNIRCSAWRAIFI